MSNEDELATEIRKQIQEEIAGSGMQDELEGLTESQARNLSIESFINALLQCDNDEDREQVAFITLIIVAFGTLKANAPQDWIQFATDCVIVAPDEECKIAIRNAMGPCFKAYLMSFSGSDVISVIMKKIVEEGHTQEIPEDRKEELSESIRRQKDGEE